MYFEFGACSYSFHSSANFGKGKQILLLLSDCKYICFRATMFALRNNSDLGYFSPNRIALRRKKC